MRGSSTIDSALLCLIVIPPSIIMSVYRVHMGTDWGSLSCEMSRVGVPTNLICLTTNTQQNMVRWGSALSYSLLSLSSFYSPFSHSPSILPPQNPIL